MQISVSKEHSYSLVASTVRYICDFLGCFRFLFESA